MKESMNEYLVHPSELGLLMPRLLLQAHHL